jgi:hypothetical protein
LQPIYDDNDQWLGEQCEESMNTVITELIDEIANDLELERELVAEFIANNSDKIRDEIYDRDDSSPIEDLMRHTGEVVMFYDLHVDIDPSDSEEAAIEIYDTIKTALQITDDSKYKDDINSLIVNAWGGELVVYFTASIEDMVNLKDNKTIIFKNPHIAIIDRLNGSGSDEQFMGLTFQYPLEFDDIYIDACLHWNYSFDVCGMSNRWCRGTVVYFSEKEE